MFQSIDLDQNNELSREELRDAFKSAGITVSDAKIEEFFDNMDLNHDGTISFDEWRYDLSPTLHCVAYRSTGTSFCSSPPQTLA